MQETEIPAVTFENVSLQIGKTNILQNISWSIPKHTIAGILGPNGAGKSSLLSLVIGLGTHSIGTISVLGEKLPAKGETLRQKIGVVLQETSLYEELTVAENLLFFASLYTVENPKKRVGEVLDLLGIRDRAKHPVHILSGGLKRRVSIARALLHNPELLVVDEPTLGVDVETRHIIWEHLRYLKTQGHTVLVASNYLDEVQAVCDSVSILHSGKLVITESPEKLIARTGHSLDIECTKESADRIKRALEKTSGVVRIETTLSGLTAFLNGSTIPDSVVATVLKTAPVNGFRFRPADLAEIFQTLELANTFDENNNEKQTEPQSQDLFTRFPVLLTILLVVILGIVLLIEVWFSQPR